MAQKNICHRCQNVWRPKGKHLDTSCPKCGSEYVGPARGSSVLGQLINLLIVLGVIGAAGYFYAKRAKEAPSAPPASKTAAKTRAKRTPGESKPTPTPAPASPTAAPDRPDRPDRPAPKPSPTEVAPKPTPTREAAPTPARLKLASQAGVSLGGSYMVRGAVKNTGGTEATGVKAAVRFYAGGKKLATVPADLPDTLAPGARATFKVKYEGPGAEGVTRFKVELAKDQ